MNESTSVGDGKVPSACQLPAAALEQHLMAFLWVFPQQKLLAGTSA